MPAKRGRIINVLRKCTFGKSGDRRRVRYRLAELAASLFCDIWLPADCKIWLQDSQFFRDFHRLVPRDRWSAERKFTVRELVRAIRELPGDTAECGVYQGATSYFICQNHKGRHLVFDSFAGLSEPQQKDVPAEFKYFWEAGDLSVSEEKVRENLAEFPFVEYYPGWIPDRFDEVKDRRFCFLHIDVDLYGPTSESLKFFYPRMVSGGIIVSDDYGFSTCPGVKKACDEFMADKPEPLIHLPTGQGIIIKR